MTEIEERTSDVYPELFHYTSADALRNIFKTSCFWATHFSDLNDSSEFSRFALKIQKFILPIVRKKLQSIMKNNADLATKIHAAGGLDLACEHDAHMFSNLMFQQTFGEEGLKDTFLCSFCYHSPKTYEAENGLLSQWRGYGSGGGVAIVLDTRGIEKLMEREKGIFDHPVNHIGSISYDDDEKRHEHDENIRERKLVRPLFDLFPKILEDFYSGIPGFSVPEDLERILTPCIVGTTLLKHHAFHEENEVRIVVSPVPRDRTSVFYKDRQVRKPIRYRRKGDGEVRYIELFGTGPLPIKRVIVGPSRIQNVTVEDVTRIIAGTDIKVVRSRTPFRG